MATLIYSHHGATHQTSVLLNSRQRLRQPTGELRLKRYSSSTQRPELSDRHPNPSTIKPLPWSSALNMDVTNKPGKPLVRRSHRSSTASCRFRAPRRAIVGVRPRQSPITHLQQKTMGKIPYTPSLPAGQGRRPRSRTIPSFLPRRITNPRLLYSCRRQSPPEDRETHSLRTARISLRNLV